ncbi:MAG: hypothetical protein LWW86_07140 [Micrococcales bacterium]|nr:hypothetical protein [Micrococcales bacterium]
MPRGRVGRGRRPGRGDPRRDGPLAGVPVAVKEEDDVAGLVTTHGGLGNSTPAAEDSEVVRRLRAAGAIVVGKTNMPEFGQFPFTESRRHGMTHNPWDLTRSPGGSSGGSAAAVAAGMVPVAIGGDGGGSIRVPASCCGLFGLKPQRGRVSAGPHPDLWEALGTIGPITRTPEDSALVYDVISGSLPSDRWHAEPPGRPFLEQARTEPGRLRIAWTTKNVVPGMAVDPQVRQAVEALAGLLAGLGHDVERIEPDWPYPTASFVPQFFASIREETRRVEHPERLEARTRHTASMGAWARGPVLARARRDGERVADRLDGILAPYALLVTPTMAALPPAIGQLDAAGSLHAMTRSMPFIAFTTLLNVSGHPGASVPAGLSREGWPIGAQLIGPRGGEGRILSVAAQLHREHPGRASPRISPPPPPAGSLEARPVCSRVPTGAASRIRASSAR